MVYLFEMYLITIEDNIKPIFHQNANSLMLALRVGQYPQLGTFMLPIPTCWYLKSLADPMQTPAHPMRPPTHPT